MWTRASGGRAFLLAVLVVLAVAPAGATAAGTAADATSGNVTASTGTRLPAPANATLTSGQPLCDEMFAFFEAQNPEEDAEKTYTVASTGGIGVGGGTEVDLNSEGQLTLDASDFGTGRYVLRDENDDPVVIDRDGKGVGTGNESQAAWSIEECTLEVGFDRGTVTVEDDEEPPTATIDVNASDDDAVYVTSPQLGTGTLAQIIDGASESSKGARVPLDGDGLQVTFPDGFECFTGEYTFRVQGTSTDASAPAFIEVERGPDDTSFRDNTVRVEQGGTATIEVRIDRCDVRDGGEVSFRLGEPGKDYEAFATFTTDGETIAVLTVDTSKAESGPASALFPSVERGSFVDRRITRDDQNPALAPTKYPMQLRVDGTVVANGEFVVEPRQTATPTPTATATPTDTPLPPDATPTPIGTPKPTETPPPGTPSATSRPVETVSASPTASAAPGDTTTGGGGGNDTPPAEPRTVVGPGVGIVVAGAIIAYALLRSQF